MLLNYLRIAFRNLRKNTAFSFINIFGLAIGTTAFLLIVQYIRFEQSYESFHANAANIYRITLDFYRGSEYVVTDCETHAPVGGMLKEKMHEVKDFVRMFHNDGLQEVKAGDKKFLDEGFYYTDPSAFNIFTLHTLYGKSEDALTRPNTIVLTAAAAKKYFGRTNVIDETIDIDHTLYHVSAVIEDLPPNTHIKFTALLSHSTLLKNGWYQEDTWGGNNEYTYLLMQPGTDLAAFNKKLTEFSASLKDKINNSRYLAQPIEEIHLYSHKTYEPEVNGNANVVYFLLVIAVFIIVIAWVNYINLSTARAMERAREVGIRKVMGSLKVQLVLQFLAESCMLNILAGILAFILYQTAFPFFRDLTASALPDSYMHDQSFWRLFVILLATGSILSGIYPAFVLSSFQPAAVLKGKFRSSSHGQSLRKGLVIFQFGATVVLMVCMCTVYMQVNYLRQYDLGMNLDQTLIVRAPNVESDSVFQSSFHSMKTELLRNPNVKMVARSESLPGLSLHELSSTMLSRYGQNQHGNGEYEYYYFYIDADFIPTLGMKLVAGRNFEEDKSNEDYVIINEAAAQRLGFVNPQEAVGTKLTFKTRGDAQYSIVIGVMKNFYQRSPKEDHIPMLFAYTEGASYFSIRLNTQDVHQTMATVQHTWSQVFPNTLFHYFFLDEKYDQQYQSDARFGQVIATFSLLAVCIACLGLFGLSSFTILQRTKEIGIRKVLGASVSQIVRLLSQDFVIIVLIAALLAIPVAYFAMEQWLSGYSVRIHLNPWMFAIPVLIILLIALLTVSTQTIRTALSNPTHSLRQE